MNRKLLMLTLMPLVLSVILPQAMAIGPWHAWEVGNNRNLLVSLGALHNMRGEAGTPVLWIETFGFWQKWSVFDALSGQGKINNAIPATYETLMQFSDDMIAHMSGNPSVNENKWIYLSPEGSGNQYNGHGMVWWLGYLISGDPTIADYIAAEYSNGVFWKYNFIQ